MKSFFTRMNSKGIVASLALGLAMTACSSKQGLSDSSELSSDVQSEESMMLGEDYSGADSYENYDFNAVGDSDLGTPTAEIISGGSSDSYSDAPVWRGSLKSVYTPGMSQWTVSRGESLSLIAQAVYGSANSYKKLQALNPEITDPNALSVGQKIRLPSGAGTAQVEQYEEPVANTPVAEVPQSPAVPESPAPEVTANTDSTNAAGQLEVEAPAEVDAAAGTMAEAPVPEEGAMDVADAAPADAPVAPPVETSMGSMVKKVDMGRQQAQIAQHTLGCCWLLLGPFWSDLCA
ncbi:MAG: LysM peptidoglycan-binding domain-containing protein [Bdellovibrionota bacterium]